MSVDIPEKESVQTDKRKKQHGGPWLMILLIIFIILFLLTSIVLGARLFERTTRDQHTVDLGLDSPSGDVELFRIQYENEQGEVTVRGVSGEDVGGIYGMDGRKGIGHGGMGRSGNESEHDSLPFCL